MRWPSLLTQDLELTSWSLRLRRAIEEAISSIPGGMPFLGPMADVAAVQDPGTSSEYARGNHAHAHGNRAGGSLHALATTVLAGFMSAADKLKLDNIVPGHVIADHGTYMPQRAILYIRGLFVQDDAIDDHTLVQFPVQLTTVQRIAYGPVRGFPGCTVYDTDLERIAVYDGSAWRTL